MRRATIIDPGQHPSIVLSSEELNEDRRFGGLVRLYGVQGAAEIRRAHVCIVGVGGVGSWAAEALARSGVGRLTLIDMDHVAESNINRQVQADSSTLGMAKVQALAQRIHGIHPGCLVQCCEEFVDAGNWHALRPNDADAVIDACDQLHAKTAMAAWALELRSQRSNRIFVTVGAAGGKRHAHQVAVSDLSLVTHDPLLAKLRYNLRKQHRAPQGGARMRISCVYSCESVSQVHASCASTAQGQDHSLNCHGYGSVVTVTATFGMCAAGWVLDRLAERSSKEVFDE